MEFEDQDEREEQKEEEEEVEFVSNYDSSGNSSRLKLPSPVRVGLNARPLTHRNPRYRDCLKNHAVGIGGHAVDGCREFLAAGAESTLDALKCAACNCHRNFHRKEPESGGSAVEPFGFGGHHQYLHTHHHQLQTHHPHGQFSAPLYRTPSGHLYVAPQTRPLALPFTSGGGLRDEQEDVSNPNISGFSKKRSRTRFTLEQKEKMLSLAERLGWRIQKQDEEIVQQFCNETGVKRRVLKVWMHNNKHTLGKKPYNSTENTATS